MSDARRTVITGTVLVLRGDDIDTDRIIPARYLKAITFDGLGEHAFKDDRAHMRARDETHPFDHPHNADATILLVGRNFGCGSSREHAPQALMRWGDGIAAVVGESFAEIFAGNCHALGVPCVTAPAADVAHLMDVCEADPTVSMSVDLDARLIRVGDVGVELTISEGVRQQLLAGSWDTTAELLAARDDIQCTASKLPYIRNWR